MSAKLRTGETTSSFKYSFKDCLNSASNVTASPLAVTFKMVSIFAISRLSIKMAPPCLQF